MAFDSDSPGLVPGDTNRARDVFVYDRDNGTLERVSRGPGGRQANGDSQRPTLSTDGRFVAFWSAADNLVDGDTNRETDCFVNDRQTHETVRVDVGPNDLQANGECARPVISGDGKLVAFESAATNLEKAGVLGKSTDTNKARDVFVRDIAAGTTTRVSVDTDGKQGAGESVRPAISTDGRYVAFQYASNLVPGDTNKTGDVFVFDRNDGSTTRVSVGSGDVQGDGMSSDPSISPDGRYVTFWSGAANLVPDDTNGKRDIFLVDRDGGTVTRVSIADDGTQGDGDSFSPNIGSGGGLVAFDSAARTLVSGDHKTKGSDIFLHSEDGPQSTTPSAGQ